MKRQEILLGDPFEERIGFARAVRVGPFIAVGGTAPIGEDGATVGVGDPAAQARRCYEIVSTALERAGDGLDDVIRTRTMLTRVQDYAAVAEVRKAVAPARRRASPPWHKAAASISSVLFREASGDPGSSGSRSKGKVFGDLAGPGFAASHPDRVRRLALWDTVPKIDELLAEPVFEMGRQMIEGDWTTYWEGMLKMLDLPSEYAGVRAESISQDNYRRMYDSGVGVDVTPLLRSIRCEALVVGYAKGRYSPPSAARDVAADIEGARLVQLGGSPYVPWYTETIDDVLEAVLPFLDEGALSDRAAPGFQTILFTDHGGCEVKHTGDGIMASVPSAVAAVTAALQIQRELAGGEVRVRVGSTPVNRSPRTMTCSASR